MEKFHYSIVDPLNPEVLCQFCVFLTKKTVCINNSVIFAPPPNSI